MFGFGVQELLIVLIIALVIFGTAKLPQIASGLGKAIRDFKRGIQGEELEDSPSRKKPPPKERENPSDETALKKGQCGTIEKIGVGKKGTA